MAQIGKQLQIVELLTEKYGCSVQLDLLSMQVLSVLLFTK